MYRSHAHAAGPGCHHSTTPTLASQILQRQQLLPLGEVGTGQTLWEMGPQASSMLVTMCHSSSLLPEETRHWG